MDPDTIRQLLNRLSPRPWKAHRTQRGCQPDILDGANRLLFPGVRRGDEEQDWPDVEFTAHAPEIVAALLEALDRARTHPWTMELEDHSPRNEGFAHRTEPKRDPPERSPTPTDRRPLPPSK